MRLTSRSQMRYPLISAVMACFVADSDRPPAPSWAVNIFPHTAPCNNPSTGECLALSGQHSAFSGIASGLMVYSLIATVVKRIGNHERLCSTYPLHIARAPHLGD